ncbi:hypothetical protein [Amaricoccus tamworthensis]|uniref:hypothetical protein n=1 Tax=Amaricoccus tamworthensis TaxID=57002 RepID=UPI003C7ADDA5
MKFAAFVICVAMAVPGLVLAAPGYVRLEDQARGERPISLSVWYPAQGEATEDVGGNAIFVGSPQL